MEEGPRGSQDLHLRGSDTRRTVSVIGAGPAALMLAAHLDPDLFEVTLFEQNASAGRKFLVAGDGGLNLTHSEDPAEFITRYSPPGWLSRAFLFFNNLHLVTWLQEIGIPTFTGTSGRVFPRKGMKPIEVLNKLVQSVLDRGARFRFRHEWIGWGQDGELLFADGGAGLAVKSDLVVFALGGGSWPVTGSNARWLPHFAQKHIKVSSFRASNCTMLVNWPPEVKALAGAPLKNISLSISGTSLAGEVVVTSRGLEGSGIYPLSQHIRNELDKAGTALVLIDLAPRSDAQNIAKKLSVGRGTVSERLRAAGLRKLQVALVKSGMSKADFLDPWKLAMRIKALPVEICGLGSVEEAISTVGGVALDEIDGSFMLRKLPGHFVIGEMLDYDAPTGGYLLQSCFSMGRFLAHVLNNGTDVVDEM